MCLEELYSALVPRKDQNRIGDLIPPGTWSSEVCFVFLPREKVGKSTGTATDTTIGYGDTNMCKEYREHMKGKGKNHVASPAPIAHAAMLTVVAGWHTKDYQGNGFMWRK